MMSLLGKVKQRDTLEVIYNTKGDSELQTHKKNPGNKKERARGKLGGWY